MKNLLGLIICFITFFSYSQEMTVFYKEQRKAEYFQQRSYVFDRKTSDQDLELIEDKAKDHSKELADYGYSSVLRVDQEKSIYYPLERHYNDTIHSSVTYGKNGEHVFISRETAEKEYKIVYIDQRFKEKTSVEYAYGKEYLIEEELPSLQWKITNETKKMFGYHCKKAFVYKASQNQYTNYKPVEVWFTKEVSCSFGPLGYWGLPGLIVKVVEKDATIVLDRVLYSLDGFKVKPPDMGEKITRDGLEDIPMLLFNEH